MKQSITKLRDCHIYNTRHSEYNFWVPAVIGQQKDTFYYNGIKNWNSLPNDVKAIKNHKLFKSKVKDFLTESS